MRLMDRIRGFESSSSTTEDLLMCPLCGQSGPPAEVAAGSVASFVLRGEVDGHPARKCFLCGAGFIVNGGNTEPIPASRWSELEADYESRTAPPAA